LPPGDDYHGRIRKAVQRSDLFVFLASRHSVASGSYALTELKYARSKWRNVSGRVLPVRIDDVPWDRLPLFLSAVTVLQPEGNVAAETLAAVIQMSELPQRSNIDRDSDPSTDKAGAASLERAHKVTVPVLIALIGMIGAIAAAAVSNWNSIFGTGIAERDGGGPAEAAPAAPSSANPSGFPGLPELTGRSLRMEVLPPDPSMHVGVASCATSACHGRAIPSEGTNVPLNEYAIWSSYDRHSSAYRTLLSQESQRIARNLEIDRPETALECLGCHSDPGPMSLRGSKHSLSDGVGCEVCHGGAANWIASHTELDIDYAGNVAAGMRPLNDPLNNFLVCISCHSDPRLNPELRRLTEAGHTLIHFDLVAFTANQPTHSEIDADYAERKGSAGFFVTWMGGLIGSLEVYLPLIEEPYAFDVLYPHLVVLQSVTRVVDPRSYSSIVERTVAFQRPTTVADRRRLSAELESIVRLNARAWLAAQTDAATLKDVRQELLESAADAPLLNSDVAATVVLAIDGISIEIGTDAAWKARIDRLFAAAVPQTFDATATRRVFREIAAATRD
jgi:hypothetical protein